jgi:hypothetical protein
MLRESKFVVQVMLSTGNAVYASFTDTQINLVENKFDATQFTSRVKAVGYCMYAKVQFKTYRISVIDL